MVAERLGRPQMPWQRYVADVLGEIDPETGRLAYDEWGLILPRQSGKSTFVLTKSVHRGTATGFFGPRQHIVYTAQTRGKAREKFFEEFVPDVEASATFADKIKIRSGSGDEHFRFPNGSRWGIEANTEKAGHGGTNDDVSLDEAWSLLDSRHEQSFRPTMITRTNTQLGWTSTVGWEGESPFLEAKMDRGRRQVAAGARSGLAYFEWSAPDGADRTDPAVWRACMPALGHTITEAAIAAELAAMVENLADFDRAYLNIRTSRHSAAPTVIDLAVWAALVDQAPPKTLDRAVAIDVTPDRGSASVAFAGLRPDGRRHLELIENKRGTGWVVDLVTRLVGERSDVTVTLDAAGPAGSLIAGLQAANIDVVVQNTSDVVKACGALFDAVADATVTHFDQPALNTALGAARKRPLGDAWAWDRKDATDISPLVAVTLALAALDRAMRSPKKKQRSGRVW